MDDCDPKCYGNHWHCHACRRCGVRDRCKAHTERLDWIRHPPGADRRDATSTTPDTPENGDTTMTTPPQPGEAVHDIRSLFPHAHAEPWNGRHRVVITRVTGDQEVFRSGLTKTAAENIAAKMRTVQDDDQTRPQTGA